MTHDDDLWGIKNDSLFRHSSFLLNCMSNDCLKKVPNRSISEDDWEDIMAESDEES